MDPLTISALIAGAISLVSTGVNYYQTKKTNETTWAREDTAVARRAADLEASGMSKTLAAGNAANTSVVSPPQMNGNGMLDALSAAISRSQVRNMVTQNAQMKKSMEVDDARISQMMSEISKNTAQTNLFNQQANKAISDITLNGFLGAMYEQNKLESVERTKNYKHQGALWQQQSEALYYKSLLDALDYDMASHYGFDRHSTNPASALIHLGAKNIRDVEGFLFKDHRPIVNFYNHKD